MNNLASLVTRWKYHHSPWDKRVLYSSSLQWNLWPRLSVLVGFARVTFILQSPEGKMECQTCPSMVGICSGSSQEAIWREGSASFTREPFASNLFINCSGSLRQIKRCITEQLLLSRTSPALCCTITVLKLGLMTRLRDSDTWWLRQSTSGPLCLLASWYRQCPNLFESHDLIWHWVLVYTFPFGAQYLAHAKPWPQVQPMVMVILVPVIAMVTTVKGALLWQ